MNQGELAMRLLLSLSEVERDAGSVHLSDCGCVLDMSAGSCDCREPDRVRRDVAAKRAIVDLCMTETDATGGKPLGVRILRHLAAIYDA